MRFDTIIVGGGLSSLVCGIKLQNAGSKCLIVSAGQNALHFSSGSFGLLGRLPDGTLVTDPLADIGKLGGEHPYSKIGKKRFNEYVALVPGFFEGHGISLKGFGGRNGWRMTASGSMKPAWLAMKETSFFESKDEKIGDKALIVNFSGFLDFNAAFIAEGLEKRGLSCRVETIHLKEVEALRQNPSEMRSVNIARVMNREENWKEAGHLVQSLLKDEDVVVLPEVFGLGDSVVNDWLREMISAKVLYVGTMPPSVPGIRVQIQLKKAFESAGGTFLMGDEVVDPEFGDGMALSVRTANLGEIRLFADAFVLASGNLFGRGLQATPSEVLEPVFGLDVDFPSERSEWYDKDFFARQNYIGFGVKTDRDFHPYRKGSLVRNLYVIGAELGGYNALYEGSGAGVAILSALKAADEILSLDSPREAVSSSGPDSSDSQSPADAGEAVSSSGSDSSVSLPSGDAGEAVSSSDSDSSVSQSPADAGEAVSSSGSDSSVSLPSVDAGEAVSSSGSDSSVSLLSGNAGEGVSAPDSDSSVSQPSVDAGEAVSASGSDSSVSRSPADAGERQDGV